VETCLAASKPSIAVTLARGHAGVGCNKIAEAEAAVSVNEEKKARREVVSDACACAAEARRASGPPKPFAHCDMKVPGQLLSFCWGVGIQLPG
jgi:hypothetical protein